MLPGASYTPDDILRVLLQRRWLILVPFALGLLLVPLIAARVPEVYRSETLIMVIPQRVPDAYVQSTVTGTIEDRLPSISDQILSRSRLERVIQDFDLYREMRAEAPMEDVVARMRTDVGTVSMRPGEQAFVVGFTSEDPAMAQRVTARLAALFIDENTNDRETQAESTSIFLESQLEEARSRLIEHEQRLEVYRKAHAGELPSQLMSNQQAIGSAQVQLQAINESMNRARERRFLVERQLAEARVRPSVAPAAAGRTDPTLSPSQQLALAQAELEGMRLRMQPGHPDLTAKEREVQALEQRVGEEASRSPGEVPVRISREEQERLTMISDLEAELNVIDHQLAAGESDAAAFRATIREYERRIATAPTRESELTELTRDYEVLRGNYESLLGKKQDSELSAEVERRQIGEQFRVLDQAALPERPTNQRRRYATIFGGAGAGLLLGLFLTFLLEYRDLTFRRDTDVERLLDLPVLAMVPTMTSEADARRARRRRLTIDMAASAVVVVSAGVALVWGLSQ